MSVSKLPTGREATHKEIQELLPNLRAGNCNYKSLIEYLQDYQTPELLNEAERILRHNFDTWVAATSAGLNFPGVVIEFPSQTLISLTAVAREHDIQQKSFLADPRLLAKFLITAVGLGHPSHASFMCLACTKDLEHTPTLFVDPGLVKPYYWFNVRESSVQDRIYQYIGFDEVKLRNPYIPIMGICKNCKGVCKECNRLPNMSFDLEEITLLLKTGLCIPCSSGLVINIKPPKPGRKELSRLRASFDHLGGGRYS